MTGMQLEAIANPYNATAGEPAPMEFDFKRVVQAAADGAAVSSKSQATLEITLASRRKERR